MVSTHHDDIPTDRDGSAEDLFWVRLGRHQHCLQLPVPRPAGATAEHVRRAEQSERLDITHDGNVTIVAHPAKAA